MLRHLALICFVYLPFQFSAQSNPAQFSEYFSESELEDLELIADFFQEEFCGTMDSHDFESCLPELGLSFGYEEGRDLISRISWRKQKKLYAKISNSTFSKIWNLCKAWILEPEDYEYRELCFSRNSDFIAFVDYLAISNPALEGYGRKLENTGFSPIVEILFNIQSYPGQTNLNDRGIQILLAIHFLTENDQMNRDRKAIRLQKRYSRNLIRHK